MRLVLDTNVVLDWLVFQHPELEPLRSGVREGRVVVCTHALVLEELRLVLDFPQLERRVADARAVLESYRAQTSMTNLDPAVLLDNDHFPQGFPRCRDPDDDKFLALAYHAKVDALVSKDKALLKLRKRSKRFGFSILTVQEMLAAATQISHYSPDRTSIR